MSYQALSLRIDDGVGWLTLSRPTHLNAIDMITARELVKATDEFRHNPAIRAVVVTGSGRAFSAGGDVAQFKANVDRAPAFLTELVGELHRAILNLLDMPKPVLAGVNGVVAGGGMGLFLAADLAIAAESATFVMAYTNIGVCPDGGSTYFLPRLIGVRRAMELLMTNRRVSSREALEIGLINRVVPDGEFAAAVQAQARALANGPTVAYAEARALLRQSFAHSAKDQLDKEARALATTAATDDFREGITAFLDKRTPAFTGK